MNSSRDDADGSATNDDGVLWTTFEREGHVHAVADVPEVVPEDELGFGATDSEAAIFVGIPEGQRWPVDLPATVEPNPISVTYNNAVVELVFARDPIATENVDASE